MKKKVISLVLGATMITSSIAGITSVSASELQHHQNGNIIKVGTADYYGYEVDNTDLIGIYSASTKTLTFTGYSEDTIINLNKPKSKAIPTFSSSKLPKWCDSDEDLEIETIYIPDYITSLGDRCFTGLDSLKTVYAPSVTSIGAETFSDCSSLENISAPKLSKIGNYAFNGCDSLNSLTVSPNLTSIGSYAFYNCTSLNSVTGNGKVKIGSYAFSKCDSLQNFNLPNAVSLGSHCFENSDNSVLTSIYAPKATIGGYCFGEKSQTITKATVGSLGNYALYNNTKIKTLTLSNTSSIGNYAFYGATGLTKIVAPKVTSVGSNAFENTKITEVDLRSVKTISNYAFLECKALTKATLGKGITTVGTGAFLNCTKLASRMYFDNVTSIGSNAFANCQAITCNSLGNKLTSIGSNAFAGCNAIKNLYVPSKTTKIGSNLSSTIRSINKTSVSVNSNTERINIYTPYNSTMYKLYANNSYRKKYIKKAITKLTISKSAITLNKGKKAKITWSINDNASNKALTFTTENTSVATFDTKGNITAKGKGTCYISISSRDGSNKIAKCKVTVK